MHRRAHAHAHLVELLVLPSRVIIRALVTRRSLARGANVRARREARCAAAKPWYVARRWLAKVHLGRRRARMDVVAARGHRARLSRASRAARAQRNARVRVRRGTARARGEMGGGEGDALCGPPPLEPRTYPEASQGTEPMPNEQKKKKSWGGGVAAHLAQPAAATRGASGAPRAPRAGRVPRVLALPTQPCPSRPPTPFVCGL